MSIVEISAPHTSLRRCILIPWVSVFNKGGNVLLQIDFDRIRGRPRYILCGHNFLGTGAPLLLKGYDGSFEPTTEPELFLKIIFIVSRIWFHHRPSPDTDMGICNFCKLWMREELFRSLNIRDISRGVIGMPQLHWRYYKNVSILLDDTVTD